MTPDGEVVGELVPGDRDGAVEGDLTEPLKRGRSHVLLGSRTTHQSRLPRSGSWRSARARRVGRGGLVAFSLAVAPPSVRMPMRCCAR